MFKNILLLASCCIFVSVRGNQPCLGAPQNPHSFAASPESCDAYIICMNGQTIRGQRCPSGLLFEPLGQTCSSSTCMDCSPFGIQNLPHPQHCNQFIECFWGRRTFRTCPYGLLFDRNIGDCIIADHIKCPIDPSPTTTPSTPPSGSRPICASGDLYHAHPTDCTRFFICVHLILWEQRCPNNYHWNPRLLICADPQTAGCAISGGGPGGPPIDPPLVPPI